MDCLEAHLENLCEIELLVETAERSLALPAGQGRTEGNAVTRAGLVLLCGYFEGFIRELLEEAVDRLNECPPDVTRLPAHLICSVLEDSTAAFRSTAGNLETIIRIFRNEESVRLNKAKLAKTGGNPTVETIETLFEAFGVAAVIDKLSIQDFAVESTYTLESQVSTAMQTELKNIIRDQHGNPDETATSRVIDIIQGKWSARKKRRAVAYVSEINELLKKRNRIAHGEGREPITPGELRDALVMVRRLTVGLHDLIQGRLEEILETAEGIQGN